MEKGSRGLWFRAGEPLCDGVAHQLSRGFKFVDGYGGKRPGAWFSYPYSENPYEHIWWSVYYVSPGIHATHVLIGVGLLGWLYLRARKNHFGPRHYNAVEGVGLYWHIVDIVWIFLFPMLYLIH